MMERHFDGSELGGVVAEIDKLFSQRFDALVNSLEIGKPRAARVPVVAMGQRWPPSAPFALKSSLGRGTAPHFGPPCRPI